MLSRFCVVGLCVFSLTGCLPLQMRGKSAEEIERDKDLDVRTIGDVTEVANVGDVQVSGVGLVTGLDGTGGSPLGNYRNMLDQELRKRKVENVKALLDSPDNALVLVTAMIPPGAHKGQPIDVQITLPPGSKATSLRGGFLRDCYLRNFEQTANINPEKANRIIGGHILARAKGSLVVGVGGETDDPRIAWVWGGGSSLIDRPLNLVMSRDDATKVSRTANAVAERLNIMFQDDRKVVRQQYQDLDDVAQQINVHYDSGLGKGDMAKATSRDTVGIRVPYAYRHNAERYLRVARLIPLREDPQHMAKYRERLQKMLNDPVDTIRAALRLEALGKESVPALKTGLASGHPLVRFVSAEALTYLGATSGVEELVALADTHKEFRAYALIALGSLDESICRSKLVEWLNHPHADLRAGAYRALRLLDERDINLGTDNIGGVFWLQRMAPRSTTPSVQYAISKRAEVLLFGRDIQLVGPVRMVIGKEYAITAEADDQRATITHVTTRGRESRQCTLALEDVLRHFVDMGAQYAEVIELLKSLDAEKRLTCPVTMVSPPKALEMEEFAKLGRDPNRLREPRVVSAVPAPRPR